MEGIFEELQVFIFLYFFHPLESKYVLELVEKVNCLVCSYFQLEQTISLKMLRTERVEQISSISQGL
jgi:hypothetical protein